MSQECLFKKGFFLMMLNEVNIYCGGTTDVITSCAMPSDINGLISGKEWPKRIDRALVRPQDAQTSTGEVKRPGKDSAGVTSRSSIIDDMHLTRTRISRRNTELY